MTTKIVSTIGTETFTKTAITIESVLNLTSSAALASGTNLNTPSDDKTAFSSSEIDQTLAQVAATATTLRKNLSELLSNLTTTATITTFVNRNVTTNQNVYLVQHGNNISYHETLQRLDQGSITAAASAAAANGSASATIALAKLTATATANVTTIATSSGVMASLAPDTTEIRALNGTLSSVDSYLSGMAWPKALAVAIFLFLILLTVIGNTLVILAVLTTRRLRTVTNCFVMNLAITDWLVGTCVMPPAVILYIVGSWRFGWILCDIWISLDVLLCTGSILSLCAISLDRYLAVTQPLTYSKKRRSKRLALFMILVVWITALSITCPPYLGWYEPGRRQKGYVDCRYNQNKGYVVFSAMGSFFIPLAVMLYVYLKIGYVLTSRRQRIVRDANTERTADHEIDADNFLSESEQIQCVTPKLSSLKTRWTTCNSGSNSKNNSIKCSKCNKNYIPEETLRHQPTFYELVEISRLSSLLHCSAMSCKYNGAPVNCIHNNIHILQHNDSRQSFTDSCLNGIQTTSNGIPTATPVTVAKLNHNYMIHGNPHAVAHPHHQQVHSNSHQNGHQKQQQHQHHHHHHRVPMRISTTKRDTKTAKTLTIVMGGFIACWLPFFVYYLLIPFLPAGYVFDGLMSFLTWVGWVNCAINPFIYAFYNPDFRTAFWRLTFRRVCKQRPPAHHMAMFRG